MPGRKFYVGSEQLTALHAEAERLKISVEDLVKIKLEAPTSDKQALENLQKEIAHLADRLQNCELILKRYCVVNEAELLDLGYLRGAIEVQAQRNSEAVHRAKEREEQR